MRQFQVLYLPVGVPTFHLETAAEQFRRSRNLLSELVQKLELTPESLRMPEEPILSLEALDAFLEEKDPSLVILQNVTFASSAYVARVLAKYDAPILVWTLREPKGDGGRLRLNSLTGAYAAGNLIYTAGAGTFSYLLGSPGEGPVEEQLLAVLRAAKCAFSLQGSTVATVGHTPEGFGFGRAGDAELLRTFGMFQKTVESRELIAAAKAADTSQYQPYLAEARDRFPGFSALPEENQTGYARLMWAYRDFVIRNHITALSSRCWPDFFTEFGTPVCAVLSMLGDLGVPAACETDTLGAVSMRIAVELSGGPVFFGDPAAMDPEENTVTFWHCGMAAPSLARQPEGPCAGVHCNRGIGPTMEFGCRGDSPVTVFRVGRSREGGLRLFLGCGEALDRPKQYHGTSLVVRWNTDVDAMIDASVRAGWEPHFVVMYGDRSRELKALAELYAIPLESY